MFHHHSQPIIKKKKIAIETTTKYKTVNVGKNITRKNEYSNGQVSIQVMFPHESEISKEINLQ